jgi:arabinogalactan endo-1,4-beta-galactosidase
LIFLPQQGIFLFSRSAARAALMLAYTLALAFPAAAHGTPDSSWLSGADVSFLQQIEDHGGVYMVDGMPREALEIFADQGFNSIRLRLWHTPAEGYNDLEKTLQMAARIESAGLSLLLDIHYSDTWTDPGQQHKPAAWEGLTFDDLKDSVYHYTRDAIAALKDQNTLPDIVQIGNEITGGMLWDDGRVGGAYDTPTQWDQFAQLVVEGIDGVEEALDPGDSVQVMIHIDRGADNAGCRWFFDNLLAQGVEFDLIGLSYYPWWHGTLDQVDTNLADLGSRYGKDIVLVETAYPWTLGWADTTHNIVGDSSQLHDGYPASPEGQRAFLEDLIAVVDSAAGGRGQGVYCWSPEWISTPAMGSAWENLALFDFSGELLGSIHAFDLAPPEAVDDLAIALAGGHAQAGGPAALQGGTQKIAGDICLAWTDPGDDIGVVGYIVYRDSSAAGSGDSLAVTFDTTYLDPGAADSAGTDWFYTVQATDAAGRISLKSNTVGEFDTYLRNVK